MPASYKQPKGSIRKGIYIATLTAAFFMFTPIASADLAQTDLERSLHAAADRGTPKTNDHRTVKQHVRKAQRIVRHAFKHRNWQEGHSYTKKRQRRVSAHRAAIRAAPAHQRKINAFVSAKRESYKKWQANQERKADPWKAQFRTYSENTKAILYNLSICESSHRNLSAGYFGWLGWRAVPTLRAGTKWIVGLPSTPSAASYEQQAVVTYEVAQKYGYGGWPSCSARLGLR